MRVKTKAGQGMTEIATAGCRIKILQRKQNLLTLTHGMGDSFKIDGGMRVDACGPSQKICLEKDGMFEQKLVAGCGT